MAADRRQRCAQLVRDRHEEVALAHLRFGEAGRHLVEPLRGVADLAGAPLVDLDPVVPARDLVGSPREREHWPHDAPREVPGEQARDEQAKRAGDCEATYSSPTLSAIAVFCLATMIEPIGVASMRTGSATAR